MDRPFIFKEVEKYVKEKTEKQLEHVPSEGAGRAELLKFRTRLSGLINSTEADMKSLVHEICDKVYESYVTGLGAKKQ